MSFCRFAEEKKKGGGGGGADPDVTPTLPEVKEFAAKAIARAAKNCKCQIKKNK